MPRTIIAATPALIAVPASAQPAPVPLPCERACMDDLAGELLGAFAARDASRLRRADRRLHRPSSILLAEAFAIRGDLIEQVEAVGNSVPYHSDTGWGR